MSMYRIGQLARAVGVSVDTVRYYEREGLLAPRARSAGGYRLFDDGDLGRLRFIRQAKALGFTLDDVAELFALQQGGGPRERVRVRAKRRVADLDRRIRELSAIRDALARLVHQCDGTGPLSACPIIDGVLAMPLTAGSPLPPPHDEGEPS